MSRIRHLVCASPQMRKVADTVRMSRDRPLLITGETGVGKDALAYWAHSISGFSSAKLIIINCAAIQESLWESEIFGHALGAFTGAVNEKIGKVEEAEAGTLFLNEIGEMPLATQAKLLTFLDTGEFQRVGETETRSIRTRVIAASNRDLESAARTNRFRQDLYYRLAGVHVWVPPLRERPDDILALAATHLQGLIRRRGIRTILLDEATKSLLVQAPWEGNVRQLFSLVETALERCIEESGAAVLPSHFSPELQFDHSGLGLTFEAELYPEDNDSERAVTVLSGSSGSILDNPDMLRQFLDQTKTSTGKWNISKAHRLLYNRGQIKIGRRTFAQRVSEIFHDD